MNLFWIWLIIDGGFLLLGGHPPILAILFGISVIAFNLFYEKLYLKFRNVVKNARVK